MFDRVFDRVFDESLLPRSIWGEETLRGIPVDMYEEEGAIVVRAVEADFEDGVLRLTLPILERDARHEIEIHGEQ